MSKIVRWLVWQIPFPDTDAKLLALYLAEVAGDDGICPPVALGQIVSRTGLGLASVKRWHAALEGCGVAAHRPAQHGRCRFLHATGHECRSVTSVRARAAQWECLRTHPHVGGGATLCRQRDDVGGARGSP